VHEAWSAALRDVMEPPVSEVTAPTGTAPQPGTLEAVKAAGLGAGDNIVAPLVSASGPIEHVVGTPVVLIVKSFWDSPTIKTARNIILACLATNAALLGAQFMNVWASGHSIFDASAINWATQLRAMEITSGPIIVAAIMAWSKKRNNDPVK